MLDGSIEIAEGIAVIRSDTPIITDVQSALDLLGTIGWEHHITKAAISKTAISEDFFKLSTGLAGEVVQKFVNYGWRVAVFGDFSQHTSQALRSYIYESNKGNHICFVATQQEAIEKLHE